MSDAGALCAALVMLGEWWSSEITTVVAGRLPDPDKSLSAMSIFQQACPQFFRPVQPPRLHLAALCPRACICTHGSPFPARHGWRCTAVLCVLMTKGGVMGGVGNSWPDVGLAVFQHGSSACWSCVLGVGCSTTDGAACVWDAIAVHTLSTMRIQSAQQRRDRPGWNWLTPDADRAVLRRLMLWPSCCPWAWALLWLSGEPVPADDSLLAAPPPQPLLCAAASTHQIGDGTPCTPGRASASGSRVQADLCACPPCSAIQRPIMQPAHNPGVRTAPNGNVPQQPADAHRDDCPTPGTRHS